MTHDEICQWVGVPPGTELRDELIAALTPLPFPQTDAEHVATFTAFLKAMPRPRKVIKGYVQR